MLPFLPKKALTLPGYRYCGPGNPLDNGPPVNTLDAICEAHDYFYSSSIPKSECDKNMLDTMKITKSKSFGEAFSKNVVVKPIIKTKHSLGLGAKSSKKKFRNLVS